MSHTFSAAYDRVLKATGCAGQEELAKKLGLRQSFITDCRRRGEFTPEVLLALVERYRLNPHWVRTGEGEKWTQVDKNKELLRFLPRSIRTYYRTKKHCLESEAGRGIWKRIDENRELLVCIQEHAPDLLKRCPWIDGWIAGTDIFLNDLAAAIEIDVPEWMAMLHTPRPWPGRYHIENYYNYAPASRVSSKACADEQAIGKD